MSAWRGIPFVYSQWKGYAYPPWSEEFRPRLEDWLGDPSPKGTPLKPGVVWRIDSWAIKCFPSKTASFWRSSPPIRAAERFQKVFPVPSPRPWLALIHQNGRGILVSDFVEGQSFLDVFETGGPALEAFPAFMALMHKHRVFHGDLNSFNMIWAGDHWVLLDLDGLRTGLHRLRPTHLIRRQWRQLYAFRDFSPLVRELFWRYYKILHPERSPDAEWKLIENAALAFPSKWHQQRNPKRRKTTAADLSPNESAPRSGSPSKADSE